MKVWQLCLLDLQDIDKVSQISVLSQRMKPLKQLSTLNGSTNNTVAISAGALMSIILSQIVLSQRLNIMAVTTRLKMV